MGKLGENIKRIREEMGLSQRQFGELIGKSGSAVVRYENGETDILASVIYKIAEVANVDFDNLMAGKLPEKKKIQSGMQSCGSITWMTDCR